LIKVNTIYIISEKEKEKRKHHTCSYAPGMICSDPLGGLAPAKHHVLASSLIIATRETALE
jgi:hypothetical protein